jgi:hypothetical protein
MTHNCHYYFNTRLNDLTPKTCEYLQALLGRVAVPYGVVQGDQGGALSA